MPLFRTPPSRVPFSPPVQPRHLPLASVVSGSLSTVVPASGTVLATSGTAQRVNFTFTSSNLSVDAPAISPGAGSLGALTVDSATTCHGPYTPPATAQTVTFTATSHSNSTATLSIVQAATSYTASGPSTGVQLVASTNYTVALPSARAVDVAVVVTPSDGGAGGAFTPTTVTLPANTSAPSVTFTYTPPSGVATRTLSFSDSGGLTDPSNLSYVVTASAPGYANDPNLVPAPFAWRTNGANLDATTLGSYLKLAFNNTSIAVVIDVSTFIAALGDHSSSPTIGWSIDFGPIQTANLSGNTPASGIVTHTLGSSLGGGMHTVHLWPNAFNTAGLRWTIPTDVLRFVKFVQVGGSDLSATSAWPYPRAKKALFYGDSILATTEMAVMGWAAAVASAFDAEFGVIGYGSQAWGSGPVEVPGLYTIGNDAASSWNKYSAPNSRLSVGLFSPQPDYIFVNMGSNGTTVQATVQSWFAAVRAAAPSAWIFYLVPFGGFGRAASSAAVAAMSDSKIVLIDVGATVGSDGLREPNRGLALEGGATLRSADSLHPSDLGEIEPAVRITRLVAAALSGGGSGGPRLGSPFIGGGGS